jgi:hypothetical protein
MSLHLSDERLADALLLGTVDDAARAHLQACPACSGRLAEAEAGLALARRDDVPEPSPLYWEALRRNVGRRVADEPRRLSWTAWLAPVAAAAGIAVLVIARGPIGAPVPVASPTAAAVLPSWSALPPLDEDEALPVLEGVVAVAGTGWDEGKGPDEYVAGLSEDEQAAVAAALARPAGMGEEL